MLPVTRHGLRELLIGSVVLVLCAIGLGFTSFWPLEILLVLIFIWLVAFFRDPERVVPSEQHAVVSPADGTVSDITEIESDVLLGNVPAVRIGIFLSVFNVHVNRSPCDGKVLDVIYKEGKFINAMRHNEASEDNESNTIVLGDPQTGKPIAVVKQIVGLIARRIVSTAKVGETVERGQRIGMIKFGSRTELTLPKWLEPEIKVQIGQSVRGAADIVALLREPVHTTARIRDPEVEPLVGRESPA
jgi:phosphatidylserine decarboxylase